MRVSFNTEFLTNFVMLAAVEALLVYKKNQFVKIVVVR